MKWSALKTLGAVSIALMAACSDADDGERAAGESRSDGQELNEHQLEKGIGPVTDLDVGPIDAQLAARGAGIFELKCSACHQLDDRYVGPPLRTVTERRTPEYIMNMMLNPAEMLARHPTARQLLAEYYTPMPAQGLSMDDARAVLEYLRESALGGQNTSQGGAGS